MTQATMENRPDVIRSRIDPLWSRIEEGQPVSGHQRAAVAEGFFRIGVHPGTAPAEALRLLARAHRLDGSNPKYPYHAGLIYLRHGQLEPARAWLSAAAALSPANHRIWAHMALACGALHHREQDVPGYIDEHRTRARSIAKTIRDGRHDFDPAAGRPVAPLLRPGRSRWPGISDITAEYRLRSRSAERVRDDLTVDLNAVVGQASRRQDRTAALAVLAVQWLVYGYHPAAIRRIIDALPPDKSPAYLLLDLTCRLFEADVTELPSMLAHCLAEGTLPDTVIALIHRTRLFGRPLEFPDLGAHTAARQFVGSDPSRHERAMRSALKKLSADPPSPVADAVPAGVLEFSTGERFALLEGSASQLVALRDKVSAHVKALVKKQKQMATEASFAEVLGDHQILTGLRESWEASRKAWLREYDRFKDPVPDLAALNLTPAEYGDRMNACKAKLEQDFGNKALTKGIGPAVEKKRAELATVSPAPSRDALSLADAMSAIPDAPSAPLPPETRPPSPESAEKRRAPPPPPADDEHARVAYAREAAERRLDANFTEAWRTLDAYPAQSRNRPAVVLLRTYLSGHQAEAHLRLGRTASALRWWNAMLADDPVNPAVLKNLAVAHTTSGDSAQAAQAWRRYLEALYLKDLLRGDVRRGASERARVHRILAGSFGTAALTAGLSPDGQQEEAFRQVPLALSSVSKVSVATAHLRLEELNHFLSHRGPALLLGASRTAGEEALAAAKEAREASVRAAVLLLPQRLRTAFETLCLRAVEEAFQEASKTTGRTRRPRDEGEEQAHAEWVRGRVMWKERLIQAIASPEGEWALSGFSGEVIANLRLIDALPLDVKDEALLRSIQQMGRTDGDPAAEAQRYNELSGIACNCLVSQVLLTALDAGHDEFPGQFRSAGRSWARNPLPDDCLDSLDDPQRLYLQSVHSAFGVLQQSGIPANDSERDIVADAVTVMSRWTRRLPGATGPARLLARFLESLDRYDEAEDVLSRTRQDAFSPRGRSEVELSFARLSIARGRFADAVDRIRELTSADPGDERLRNLFIQAYNRWITSGENVPEPAHIAADLAQWTDAGTVRDRRILAINAALTRHRDRGESARPEPLVDELRALHVDDPGYPELRYHLIAALFELCRALRKDMRDSFGEQRQALRQQLDAARAECEENAATLIAAGALDQEQTDSVRRILDAVGPRSPRPAG